MTQRSTEERKTQRDLRYDCLRAVAVVAIIMVHAMPIDTYSSTQWWFNHIMTPILLAFVGIYFMLSGMFILEHGTEDIGRFYKKRFISVGIPFLVYGLIYYCYNVRADSVELTIPTHIARYISQVVTAGIPRAGHFWFMYTIAAFYLCAPFLARMVKQMGDKELTLLLLLMLGIHTIETAGEIIGMDMRPWAQSVLYTGWVYFFLLGYGLRRLCKKEQLPVFVGLAVLGLVCEVASDRFLPGWIPQSPHKSPAAVFICAGIFLLFEYHGKSLPGWVHSIGMFVSKYSFSVFLIHFLILSYFVQPVLLRKLLARSYILGTLAAGTATFFLSLGCAMLVDRVAVRPLEYFAQKALTKKVKN